VNYYLHSFLAKDRLREADQYRLAALVASARPARPARIRRRVARVLAAVSRLAGIVVRRLDQNVADDLARSLHGRSAIPQLVFCQRGAVRLTRVRLVMERTRK
jgi:hypothetical protein